MDVVATQLAELRGRHPGAQLDQSPDGQQVLVVPGVATGAGWNHEQVTLRLVVPSGYPHVQPDCFYTEPQLGLATGAEPTNSSLQPIFGGQYRWFSWHLAAWDPASGSLDQYVRFCERRLKEAK